LLPSRWTPRWPGCMAWRVGGHISKRGCGLGWSFYFVSFCFLCIEAATGNHVIKVHHCCCPGGLLDGLSVGSGGEGWGALVLSIVYVLVVQQGRGLLHRWCGLSGRRISRWNASTSLLCAEVAVGENYSSLVSKAVGNLLGCLYVGCVRCGAAQSLLLFGYVLVLCSEPLDLYLFPSFAFASWLPQAIK